MDDKKNVIHFKSELKCIECGKSINEQVIYYFNPLTGFHCEHCPGFERGGVTVTKETVKKTDS